MGWTDIGISLHRLQHSTINPNHATQMLGMNGFKADGRHLVRRFQNTRGRVGQLLQAHPHSHSVIGHGSFAGLRPAWEVYSAR